MVKEVMMPFAYLKPTDEAAEATVDIEPQYRKEKRSDGKQQNKHLQHSRADPEPTNDRWPQQTYTLRL